MGTRTLAAPAELEALEAQVNADGVAGLPGAFTPAWVRALGEDFAGCFAAARAHPGGTISRGPERHYLAVHPEDLRGFADLVTHPLIAGLSAHMLGPDYQVVEVGFDVPLPGALDQPWHRDFEMPEDTAATGVLTSLAFNVPTVGVTPEMGPFEYAPGTHREDGSAFAYGMFPDRSQWPRYAAMARRRCPALGDASVRTGLCIHRGTANRSDVVRPVLVLGVVAREVETDEHSLELTRGFHDGLAPEVRSHLRCTVVDRLEPITQRHDIEGLMMGVAE